LTEAEVAFYEALAENGTAVRVMANEALRLTARELVESVRSNATIDLALKETTRAKQRVLVKRILRRHGYPPDQQEAATATVLRQAELFGDEWTASVSA
jgi:type I restriction enzyme, R subunit